MTKTIIRCDYCDVPLDPHPFHRKYRIRVTCERMEPDGPVCSGMLVDPPFPKPLDFCGTECLGLYLNDTGDRK